MVSTWMRWDMMESRNTGAAVPQQIQMFGGVVRWFWMSLALILVMVSLRLPVGVQAQFSFNPDDYDFGWLAVGAYDRGQVPDCTFCFNAFAGSQSPGDSSNGPYWNLTVGLFRCTGLHSNELWAYQSSTNSIVSNGVLSYLGTVLCIDALLWDSMNLLKLRPCDASVVTQQWTIEGTHIRSALTDASSGKYLYLWGVTPDWGNNNSTNFFHNLFLSSEMPSGNFPWTQDFTFLSMTNLVDRSTNRLTSEGLLQISNSSRDQIAFGGFEEAIVQSGTGYEFCDVHGLGDAWNQSSPNYFVICGWVVETGPITYVKKDQILPANGSYSVHLNTFTGVAHYGSVSQTVRTEKRAEYALSFYFTGFPPNVNVFTNKTCGAAYNEARLQVQVTNATTRDTLPGLFRDGSGLAQNFTTIVTALTNITPGWMQKTVSFTASTDVTTISFSSLNFNDPCGPMIDTVEVTMTKGPPGRNIVVLVVASSVGGLAGLAILSGIVCGVYYYRTREDYSGMYKLEHGRVYSKKELSIATKKFSSVLGEGGFGTVYKAEFPDGTVGAVKVEKARGLQFSSKKVLASEEIAVLLRVHHRNLVNLTGFSIHKGRHILVFEYLPNGSLYDRLHQSIVPQPGASMDSVALNRLRSNGLPWRQRVKIAADVACGLEYLHHEADPPIVHRDVKSQNILLTISDSAKLADFGLSRAAPVDATSFQSIETMVRGSIGYLDPQYFFTGVFSTKSDVYSFGIVLLELISGHQAVYNAISLASWAAPYMTAPSLYHELVDKSLKGEFNANELETLVDLSKMCMHEDGKMRPNMRQVVAFLNSKQLPSVHEETSDWMKETLQLESYYKTKPNSLDSKWSHEMHLLNSHSRGNFVTNSGPQPRD